MQRISKKHILFFVRWFVRYNGRLYYLQAKMPELPDRPDRQLARSLDTKRKVAHSKIRDITGGYGSLCRSCGRCCLERIERYTDFDQFIHAGMGEPLDHYDRKILNLPVMLSNSVKRAFAHLRGSAQNSQKPCRYLGKSGCTLPHEKRPILCVSWFCPKYIFGMQPSSLDSLEEPLTEILSIHDEIAEAVTYKKGA
ncbi:MAG TPA: hypothetical protein VGK02_07055 [Candidatus Aquicultor sp.]|jgi:Fe-S-cluster containining protein